MKVGPATKPIPPGTEVIVTVPDNTIAIGTVVTTITIGEFAGSVVVSFGSDQAILVRAENVGKPGPS